MIEKSDEFYEGREGERWDAFNELGIRYCGQLFGADPLVPFEEDFEHRIELTNEAGERFVRVYELWPLEEARIDALMHAMRETGDQSWRTSAIVTLPAMDADFEEDEA